MKFEKFLKSTGTHGAVVTVSESEKWLECGGVSMVIPRGVDNLLGGRSNSEFLSITHELAKVEYDDPLKLVGAVLLDPQGKANDIYRVFETDLGERVAITNADYGLLEKSDLLSYAEVEVPEDDLDDITKIKYVMVFDENGNIQGYITGSQKF